MYLTGSIYTSLSGICFSVIWKSNLFFTLVYKTKLVSRLSFDRIDTLLNNYQPIQLIVLKWLKIKGYNINNKVQKGNCKLKLCLEKNFSFFNLLHRVRDGFILIFNIN